MFAFNAMRLGWIDRVGRVVSIRVSARKLSIVVFGLIITVICFNNIQHNGGYVSRIEFLEHALHRDTDEFEETNKDGTGGWVTRWFTMNSQDEYSTVWDNQSSPIPECRVHTYIDTSIHPRNSDEFAIVEAWAASFWALGFRPVVLTDEDARHHSHYSQFRSLGLMTGTLLQEFGKWLAMAQHGGLFVDYRVIFY